MGAIHRRRTNETKIIECDEKVKVKSKKSTILNVGRNNNTGHNVVPENRREDYLFHLDVLSDFLMDIMYLFGSLFLSLLPMWRPWMVEVAIQEDDEDNESSINVN